MEVDLILQHAAQLVTCAAPGGMKRGSAMADAGLILDGAIAVEDGRIVAVGPTPEVLANYAARRTLDVSDRAICPGLVDAHTHLVYAGDRTAEFELRIRGSPLFSQGGGARPILVPTFLGAHAVPPEYQGQADAYIDILIAGMLPAVSAWYQRSPFARARTPLFCDVFCETNVFGRDQAEHVLRAGLALGMPAKIHLANRPTSLS